MGAGTPLRDLSARDLEPILAVASKLAAPFDLDTMLGEVASAAKQVLHAERVSVWLHDPGTDELVLRLSGDLKSVRVPAGMGLVGSCARNRRLINVPDCYADERFDPSMDRRTGYRTRCMLTLPLIDHEEVLVGVIQVLNKASCPFDEGDEALATVLAAQCAVALQRVRMTEALIEGQRMRQELEIARQVQRGTLPAAMPAVPGYDVYGTFEPADLTGGDTFDLAVLDQGLLVVLGDATGHGMGPALSVAQMQAMLRMAFRLGADLDTAFKQVNNLLDDMLPDDRFITAFIGLLDPAAHRVRFHSGGQGPILVFRAATGELEAHRPTCFPLAAMPLAGPRAASTLDLDPGDILVLLSDGLMEYRDPEGREYGQGRVHEVLREHHREPMAALARILLGSVRAFARGAPQEDDVSAVLLKREDARPAATAGFGRSFDALDPIFAFVGEAFGRLGIDASLRPTVELAIEELFTNMVKYGKPGQPEMRLTLSPIPGGVEVTLVDDGAEPFDITRLADADVGLPVGQRRPGGLGIHLVRRMVDAIEYRYREDLRQARITFRKTLRGSSGSGDGSALRGGEADMFEIEIGSDGAVTIAGRLDAAHAAAAQAFLDRQHGTVTADCRKLEYISSAGLGVLLKTQKRLMAEAGKLRLVGVNRHLRDVFHYSGFDQIFEIEPLG
jgi:phosphoserine phosphatase